MMNPDIVIATMTWARTEKEELELKASLTELSNLDMPVVVADGGSNSSFINFLKGIPHFTVIESPGGGLVGQIKASLDKAATMGSRFLLYTEPDKKEFFEHQLIPFLHKSNLSNDTGIVLASRSPQGFASFPPFQQTAETTMNKCCEEVIGKPEDYCYGPFVLNQLLVPYVDHLGTDMGWGWRPFIFHMAHRLQLSVTSVSDDYLCPEHQQLEEDEKEKLYRMRQLEQSIRGLLHAATIPIQP